MGRPPETGTISGFPKVKSYWIACSDSFSLCKMDGRVMTRPYSGVWKSTIICNLYHSTVEADHFSVSSPMRLAIWQFGW